LWQPSISGVDDSSRSVMHVLYTFLQYFPHAVINWIQILQIWDYSWDGINSGVSLSNNAIVAHARWAFQVSQGSVETLFSWGGKRLHHVAANLFRKLCAKFHHNYPSFVGDITENILVSFFLDTVYIILTRVYTACLTTNYERSYNQIITSN